MYPRRELVKLFSSFLELEKDRFGGWVTNPKLRRHMEECLTQISETSDRFWVHYWHQHWQKQTSPFAREHLAAYLQEPAYWAADHIARRFSHLNDGLADCFQVAIAQFDTILNGFNPQYNSTLKGYARAIFNSTIKEILRQRQETDICSDWGLLRKLSQKRVTEALEQQGFSPDVIAASTLAWQGFKQLYVPEPKPGTRQLGRPNVETWSAIAQYYNQHCHLLTPSL
ncbi:MAG: sigma-70 family RNA polymerase sigma factor, partial [Halothece sp. Uz-M2-17]|nr:sigma-70 family RNA polymerase sigma factor [Halothece sp. Uz-M2-17]